MAMLDELKHVVGIQEKKVSTLILGFIFFSILGAYLAITDESRDIPSNIVAIIQALILAIAGINAADIWFNRPNRGSVDNNTNERNDNDVETWR